MIIGSGVVVTHEQLTEIGISALERVGVPRGDATATVEMLLYADMRGVESHGIQRLLMYVPRLRKGLINPTPGIRVEEVSPVMRVVLGDNGLGQVVAKRGVQEAIDLAREFGAAVVGCRDSNHFGAAAPFVQMACDERMIAIVSTNAFPTMAPWGGSRNVVGNNPFAVGVPCEGDPPFILDIAMSVSSRGRIRNLASLKQRIPLGWALDAEGTPTTDPLEALKGFVLPMGGHKGYGLALAVDILAGVLTGAGFADGVKSLLQQWDEPQHVGHLMIVIDPARFMPWELFAQRMSLLRRSIRAVPPLNPKAPVVIPGEPEAQIARERSSHGIPMQESVFESLKGLTHGQYVYDMPTF